MFLKYQLLFISVGSGTIELDEFITMMTKRFAEVDEEAELRESFKVFDKDGLLWIHNKELKFLRFCQICLQRNAYVVEDEFHFFCVCPAYEEIRSMYFKPQWIRGILTVDKFYLIMSSPEKSSILLICKFLLSAIYYRQELLLRFESSHN